LNGTDCHLVARGPPVASLPTTPKGWRREKSACVLYLDPPRVLLETFFGGVYSIRVFFSFLLRHITNFRWQSGYFHAIPGKKELFYSFVIFAGVLVDYITPVYGCRKRSNSLADRET
jgi:hypothetical protein